MEKREGEEREGGGKIGEMEKQEGKRGQGGKWEKEVGMCVCDREEECH